MENTIAKNIIYYAYNRTKQHEVAKALGYSTKQLTRICKVVFNRTYKQFQRELIFSTILERIRDCNTPQSIAEEFFNGNVHQLYAYVKSFLNVPPKQISTKGGHYMTAAEIQILETKVITMLATNPIKNLTLKQLGVPRFIITNLRQKGYNIISVPGRYNIVLAGLTTSAYIDMDYPEIIPSKSVFKYYCHLIVTQPKMSQETP